MRRPSPSPRRPGFTLVEILVVMVILAILVAMLLPAIQGAIRTAKDARVTGEIQTMSQAMASFKEKFGEYPPSRILLNENGHYNIGNTTPIPATNPATSPVTAGADMTYGQLAQRSVYYLRKFWPRVTLSTSGPVFGAPTVAGPQTSPTASKFYDFNGNGEPDYDALGTGIGYLLEGHECLAFFLGGIPQPTSSGFAMSGFGRVPENPFANNNPSATYMYNGSNRTQPFFEFKNERLVDGEVTPDTFPGYADPYYTGTPDPADFNHYYAYFNAYGGEAYDPNDENFAEPESGGTVPAITRRFRVTFPVVLNAANGNTPNLAVSPAPNPYTTNSPVSATSTAYQNGRTFQIISSGADGQYGAGGIYAPNGVEHLPLDPGPTATPNLNTADSAIRSRELDNLTNFANGRLE